MALQTPTVSLNDTIRLQGTATDVYGTIVKWEWKFGSGEWSVNSTGDTITISPLSQQSFICSLRVTDDDGMIGVNSITINVFEHIVTDIDGNVYGTITIGTQTWTVENLRTTKYKDGAPILKLTGNNEWSSNKSGAYCYYNNDSTANSKKYGALYNWHSVNTGKLAPDGWHIPTNAEWNILKNYLIVNGYNWDGTTTGNKIAKAMAAKTDWDPSGIAGTPGNDMQSNNESGFSALSGGSRIMNQFDIIGRGCYWWTTTGIDETFAYGYGLFTDHGNLIGANPGKGDGFFVRLLRD